jgi:hypothetical protein
MRVAGLLLLVAALHSQPANAQSEGFQAGIQATASLRGASQPLAPQTRAAPSGADLLAARSFNSRAPGATLMIIGGAAVVAGILVGGSGGTLLIVGGVGVGAYGVYLYTR